MEYINFNYSYNDITIAVNEDVKEFVLFIGKEFVCSRAIVSGKDVKEYVIGNVLPLYLY